MNHTDNLDNLLIEEERFELETAPPLQTLVVTGDHKAAHVKRVYGVETEAREWK
jgi:hypothetical protein